MSGYSGSGAVALLYNAAGNPIAWRSGATIEGTAGEAAAVSPLVWDGTNNYRMRSPAGSGGLLNTGVLAVLNHVHTAGGRSPQWGASALGDNDSGTVSPITAMQGYNAVGYDRWRNNYPLAILASAARTGTITSANFRTYNARGISLVLQITANPGAAQNLIVTCWGVVGGNTFRLDVSSALVGGTNNFLGMCLGPGITQTWNDGSIVSQARAVAIPDTCNVSITHSGAGSWTYRLDAALMV